MIQQGANYLVAQAVAHHNQAGFGQTVFRHRLMEMLQGGAEDFFLRPGGLLHNGSRGGGRIAAGKQILL